MDFLKQLYVRLIVCLVRWSISLFWYLCRYLSSSSGTIPAYIAVKELSDVIETAGDQNVILLAIHKDMEVLFQNGFFVYNIETIQDMNHVLSIVNDLYHANMILHGKISPGVVQQNQLH